MTEAFLSSQLILRAYSQGIFPMAESAESMEVKWYQPHSRGILPLEYFHVPRRLQRTLLSDKFSVTSDQAFEAVIKACASPAPGREETWINHAIEQAFIMLYQQGYAHSIEVWEQDILCGGLYGLAIGGAFFGESMFSRARDASKIALVHLVGRLISGGFTVLDTQFGTCHLAQFGGVEIPHEIYMKILQPALKKQVHWVANMSARSIMSSIEVYARTQCQ